jgi:hypothetical protein
MLRTFVFWALRGTAHGSGEEVERWSRVSIHMLLRLSVAGEP